MVFGKRHITSLVMLLLFFAGALNLHAQHDQFLSFSSGNLVLNGTLSLPAGNGPFPLLLLVHGSGPQTRDVTTPLVGGNFPCLYPGIHGNTVRPFKELRDGLVQFGFAVFSYDKRTFTYGATLDQTRITLFDYANDAGAALDFLKTRSEIDTSCIVVLGHSQGGCVTAWLARQRNDIDALVSLAGPATSIDTLVGEQLRYIYATCDDSLTGVNVANQMQSAFGSIRNGTWPPLTPLSGAYPAFWQSWMQLADSVSKNYNLAGKPVLFIHGDDDYNVPVSDTARWQAEINPNLFDLEVFAGLNHFLSTANRPNVSEDVIQAIGDWLPICRTTRISESNLAEKITVAKTSEGIQIWKETNIQVKSVRLYDMQGKAILEEKMNGSNNSFITIPFEKAGMFIIELTTMQNSIIRKII